MKAVLLPRIVSRTITNYREGFSDRSCFVDLPAQMDWLHVAANIRARSQVSPSAHVASRGLKDVESASSKFVPEARERATRDKCHATRDSQQPCSIVSPENIICLALYTDLNRERLLFPYYLLHVHEKRRLCHKAKRSDG